jgi:hypothetical protein
VTSYETSRNAVAVLYSQIDSESKDDIIRYLFRRSGNPQKQAALTPRLQNQVLEH